MSNGHAEAEWSYGSICDPLPDSNEGTVLDPDLESILCQEMFLTSTDGEKMGQVAGRLREEKPGKFDIAEQMAEALRVSLDNYEDPKEGWRLQERSQRIFGVFDTMANLATPEEMERFLNSDTAARLTKEWGDDKLNTLLKRCGSLGNSYRQEKNPGDSDKLKLLTQYVLGQVIEEGKEVPLDPHREETTKKPESDHAPFIPSQIRADSFIGKKPAKSSALDAVEIDGNTDACYSYAMGITAAKERIANNPPDSEKLLQLANSSPGWRRRFRVSDYAYNEQERMARVFQAVQTGRLERVKKALIVGKYPTWFSSYVISAYTKLGEFDPQAERFNAREPGSITLLPEVNTEALYEAYKETARYYESGKLESADFSELYGKEIAAATSLGLEQRRETQSGEWHVIYVRRKNYSSAPKDNSSDQIQALLAGQCTDWFPGDTKSIKDYLFDNKEIDVVRVLTTGENNIPRIMICTNMWGSMQMILGIGENGQVELEMMGELREAVGGLLGGRDKIETMDKIKEIDEIRAKQQKNEELSAKDIARLWFEFDPHSGENYFWQSGGVAKLQAARSERNFIEDVKTIVGSRILPINWLAEMVLSQYIEHAEELKVFFYDRGVFFTEDKRYEKRYGSDPLDSYYRNRLGYGANSSCTDIVNRLIEDGREIDLCLRPGLFAEGLIKEMGGKFDPRLGVRVANESLNTEELTWEVEIDFTELAKEAKEKGCLPGFIGFIAIVKPPLGSFDINNFADSLLATEDPKVIRQLVNLFDHLRAVGLSDSLHGFAVWRLCELCDRVKGREDKLLASRLSMLFDDDFWADMPGNLAECVRAMRAGIVPYEHQRV